MNCGDMNCADIREQLIETARGRGLSSDLRAVVFTHAAGCEGCARQLEMHRQLSGALADLAMDAESAPARVEHWLQRCLPPERPLVEMPLRRTVPVSQAGWLAAAAVIAAAGFTWPLLRPPAPVHPVAGVQEVARRVDAPPPVTTAAVLRGPAERAPRRKAALAQDAANVAYADFTQLPYAPDLSPTESTDIVRVQLPRESLLAMGIPVSADLAGQVIQADVLLGMDGTARAIRIAN